VHALDPKEQRVIHVVDGGVPELGRRGVRLDTPATPADVAGHPGGV
jgi:hypothetical protein